MDPSHTRIDGKKVLSRIHKWLKKHPEFKSQVRVRETSCMKQCDDSPVLFVKEQRKHIRRLTKEKLKKELKKIKGQLESHP